jgi:isopenicillin N synthase-like dioxygenase
VFGYNAQMSDLAELPIVDIAAFEHGGAEADCVARDVHHALSQIGFMYVRGHGVDSALIQQAFTVAMGFFAQARQTKSLFAYTDASANFGFQALEVESLDPASEPDLKETFTMRNVRAMAPQSTRWPDMTFRDTAVAFHDATLAVAYGLLRILAASFQLPREFFTQRHQGENVTLRFLHYPANALVRSSAQLGAGAHTDYGSITLLFQDDVGGLELRGLDGRWRSAPIVPGALIVNTGDLMQRWTNDCFRSTLHRVRTIDGTRDRYSITLFVDPDHDVDVQCIESCQSPQRPARYPAITAGEHIRQKIAATHLGRHSVV